MKKETLTVQIAMRWGLGDRCAALKLALPFVGNMPNAGFQNGTIVIAIQDPERFSSCEKEMAHPKRNANPPYKPLKFLLLPMSRAGNVYHPFAPRKCLPEVRLELLDHVNH